MTMDAHTHTATASCNPYRCPRHPEYTAALAGASEVVVEAPRDDSEPMLRWFAFEHLKAPQRVVAREYAQMVRIIVSLVPRSPERTVALRKLLESKDAAVRASLPL